MSDMFLKVLLFTPLLKECTDFSSSSIYSDSLKMVDKTETCRNWKIYILHLEIFYIVTLVNKTGVHGEKYNTKLHNDTSRH